MLVDSTTLADYLLDRFTWVVEGLQVYPERMLRNLEASFGLTFSGRVLLALVEAGLPRERAYELVQRNAMRAWDEELPLAELLAADADVTAVAVRGCARDGRSTSTTRSATPTSPSAGSRRASRRRTHA